MGTKRPPTGTSESPPKKKCKSEKKDAAFQGKATITAFKNAISLRSKIEIFFAWLSQNAERATPPRFLVGKLWWGNNFDTFPSFEDLEHFVQVRFA